MFAFSFKMSPKKILAVCCCLGVIVCGFCVVKNLVNDKVMETAAITRETVNKLPKVKINDDRLKVAEILGWEIEREPEEIEEVIIPENFDEVYIKYNDLQKQNGFDLEKYKGKRCKRFTYSVKNYPNEDDVVMDLLVYNEKVIGGDISSKKLDGFMQGLLKDK